MGDNKKHCQRHNGPEGWVLITSSNTNLDQISSSESRPSIIFKISTKHQPLHKTWFSKSWPNLASESWPRFNCITSTKHQQNKNWLTSNFNFKIFTKYCAQSLNKRSAFWRNLSWVSEPVSDKGKQWSDSGPTKIAKFTSSCLKSIQTSGPLCIWQCLTRDGIYDIHLFLYL